MLNFVRVFYIDIINLKDVTKMSSWCFKIEDKGSTKPI